MNLEHNAASAMLWHTYRFDELSLRLLYHLLALRSAVFVVEQQCVYNDLDGDDLDADHLVGSLDGMPVACARILAPDVAKSGYASIGRVIVHPEHRRAGCGSDLMRRAIVECRRLHPSAPVWIGAQAHLEGFYSALGFRTAGPEYDLDGIPHLPMTLEE